MRRLLYSLLVLLAVTLLIFGGYYLRTRYFASPTDQSANLPAQDLPALPVEPAAFTPSGLPDTSAAAGRLSAEPAVAFFIGGDHALLIRQDGQVIRSINGQEENLSRVGVADLAEASFSFDGKYIVAGFGEKLARHYSIFDVAAKTWRPLPAEIVSPVWAPKDNRLAYYSPGEKPAVVSLDISNEKAAPVVLARLAVQAAALSWPNSGWLIVNEEPSAFQPGSLWALDLKTGTSRVLAEDYYAADGIWDENFSRGLLFWGSRANRGGRLVLVNNRGEFEKQLAILTLPGKCVFRSASASSTAAAAELFCAVPRDQRALEISPLPDAYYQQSLFTTDDVLRISLSNGAVVSVYDDPRATFDAVQPVLRAGRFYFINRLDGLVYWLSLGE